MKVAAFGPVGPLAPSWRVRVLLPQLALRRAGVELEPMPFFRADAAKRFEKAGLAERAHLIFKARRELGSRVSGLDETIQTVLVQRHVDMLSTLTWERRVAEGKRIVLDIDDAIWLDRPRDAGAHRMAFLKGARRKVRFLAGQAEAVIAGNEFLADWLARYSSRVLIVPSLVDPSDVHPREHAQRREITWGWIGSRSTAQHLHRAAPTLRKAAREFGTPVRLLVLGSPQRLQIPGIVVEQRHWSEVAEREALREIDIGLMPLPDNAWTRGKCAYKALLYMSAGIPVVADDVGVSRSTVGHNEGGIVVEASDDWIDALRLLSSDLAERSRLGLGGRRRAENQFSLSRWTPVLASAIRGAGATREGERHRAAKGGT